MTSSEQVSAIVHYRTPNASRETSLVLPIQPISADEIPWDAAVAIFLGAALTNTNTKRAYRRHLENAIYLWEGRPVVEVTAADLTYYRHLVVESDLAHNSKAQALTAVRSFLQWFAVLWGHPLSLAVIKAALKSPKGTVQKPYVVLSEREIEALFETVDSVRDRTILAMLLGSGLRASEVSALDIRDLIEDAEGDMLVSVRGGKGNRDRLVPVRFEVEKQICNYLSVTGRYLGQEGPLFLQEDRGAEKRETQRLTARSIGRVVKRCAAAAGISAKRVSPHALRHCYGIRCIRLGANVVAVSKLLGHSNISTTQRYVDHLALGELREAVPKLPLGD